jgi:hypothetical protein
MPKEIHIDIDEKTGDFELKLEGYNGKGCKDIAKHFEKLGKVVLEEKLPSFDQAETTTAVKTGH